MSDVFIAFSRPNRQFAHQLADKLKFAGKSVWGDWEELPRNVPNWWVKIEAEIEAADNLVFILSPDTMASVVCNMVLDYAIELQKRIIPVAHQEIDNRDNFASVADFNPNGLMNIRLGSRDPRIIARENWQRLSYINWLHIREGDDFEAAIKLLIRIIETDVDYVKAHTHYLVRALEWRREDQPPDLLLSGAELDRAEAWLHEGQDYAFHLRSYPVPEGSVANPLPQVLHRNYIRVSRAVESRRRRRTQALIWAAVIVITAGALMILPRAGTLIASQGAQARADRAATKIAVQGDFEAAIVDYTQAIEVEPEHAAYYVLRGQAYLLRAEENITDDEADLRRALADWRQAKTLGYDLPNEIQAKMIEIGDKLDSSE